MENVPIIAVEQSSIRSEAGTGVWDIEWLITNKSRGPIAISSARLPHGQFKSDEQRYEPPLKINAGEPVRFRARVYCHEPPGLVTENAFIIFQVFWLNEWWRIFVRIHVVANENGTPQTGVELISTQKVGFSTAN
jgi:hypothetical protein